MGLKLPIGIQSFEDIRQSGYLYVDKTKYIYELVHGGKPYFLSRPRRFGKSLFLSSLRAYWEGKKELFHGLDIERLENESADVNEPWEAHPVFYFDFNKASFTQDMALESVLDEHLLAWEQIYGVENANEPLGARFRQLILKANEQTGKKAVVLVDEYDKPLLEVMSDDALEEHNKAVFKGFFSTLKSYDEYLKFVFLTGVTKFSKVSIFSDLNQLKDISMRKEFAGICGITDEEIKENLMPEVERMADENDVTPQECLQLLKKTYDGYKFHPAGEDVYNPFSLMNSLDAKELGSYWFSTGTPTFLVKMLKRADFDIRKFTDDSIFADGDVLTDYRVDNPDPVPLLYQTGYLTIRGYDKFLKSYILGYPNDEVKYAFIKSLAPEYLYRKKENSPFAIQAFALDIKNADLDSLRDRFISLFASLPYVSDEKPIEQNFQNVIYIVFMLLGQFVRSEIHSAKGRADCIVETDTDVFIFEFKRDASADEALIQIEENGYATPYLADKRNIYRIGANFDSSERTLNEWKVKPEDS